MLGVGLGVEVVRGRIRGRGRVKVRVRGRVRGRVRVRVRGRVRVKLGVRKSEFRIFRNQDFFWWYRNVKQCQNVQQKHLFSVCMCVRARQPSDASSLFFHIFRCVLASL